MVGVTTVAPPDGACVSFWYHMFGDAIGTLSVYTEMSGDLGSARWSRTGSTNVSQWYEASINVDPRTEFRVSHLLSVCYFTNVVSVLSSPFRYVVLTFHLS